MVQFMMRPAPPAKSSSSNEPVVSVATLHVPREAQNEFVAGQRAMEGERWTEARKHFEKALKRYAAFPQALHGLALLDIHEQRPEHAVERLRQAVEIDGSYAEGHLDLSRLLNSLERPAESLEEARKAAALRPDLWQAQYELGVAALSIGMDDLALEACNRVESSRGLGSPEARLLRAGIWLKRGRYVEAKTELEEFLRLAPKHVHAPLARKTLQEIDALVVTPTPR
jgi:tetratricopeptide (TPR) repeat protein